MNAPLINDETLSAFLDNELSPEEMEHVRKAVAAQPQLAARLSALRQANRFVQQHAHGLDGKPMPNAVMELLSETDQQVTTSAPIPPARLPDRYARYRFPAFAATLALVIGLVWLLPQRDAQLELPDYEQQLAQALSGNTVHLNDESSLISHFSFQDRTGRYCRQYLLNTPAASTENIACHDAQGWTQVASMEISTAGQDEYQTASRPAELESILDDMMQGEVLPLDEERARIRNNWLP